MTAIKERPILFSAPMVNAIRAGRKTMTRRIVSGPALLDLCPHGKPGDRLWVREAWRYNDLGHGVCVEYKAGGPSLGILRDDLRPAFRGPETKWRPSIHMPRWASRITLEITDVRVERLHGITEDDAEAEGARFWLNNLDGRTYDNAEKDACRFTKIIDPQAGMMSHRGVFATLWESIHGKGSWMANPWLWAITFREITQRLEEAGEQPAPDAEKEAAK